MTTVFGVSNIVRIHAFQSLFPINHLPPIDETEIVRAGFTSPGSVLDAFLRRNLLFWIKMKYCSSCVINSSLDLLKLGELITDAPVAAVNSSPLKVLLVDGSLMSQVYWAP